MFTPNRLGGWSFGVQIPNDAEDVKTNTSKPRTLAKVIEFPFFMFWKVFKTNKSPSTVLSIGLQKADQIPVFVAEN